MPSVDDKWVPLSVGSIDGGARNASPLDNGLRMLARNVRLAVESLPIVDVSNEASVNVIFHIPGIFHKPDYTGMRTGSWIGKKRLQIVQVAVPPGLARPSDVSEFLAYSIEAAIPLASERIARFRRSSHLSLCQASAAATAAAVAQRDGSVR